MRLYVAKVAQFCAIGAFGCADSASAEKFFSGADRARAVRVCDRRVHHDGRKRRRTRRACHFDQAFAWSACARGARSREHACKPHICLLCVDSLSNTRASPRRVCVWQARRLDVHTDKSIRLRRPFAVATIRFVWVRGGLSVAGVARTNLLTRKKSGNNFCPGVTHA